MQINILILKLFPYRSNILIQPAIKIERQGDWFYFFLIHHSYLLVSAFYILEPKVVTFLGLLIKLIEIYLAWVDIFWQGSFIIGSGF